MSEFNPLMFVAPIVATIIGFVVGWQIRIMNERAKKDEELDAGV